MGFNRMNDTIRIDYIKNIDWKLQKQSRSGAILYKLQGNEFVFLMGIDTKSGEITDFAGGIKLKQENQVSGGLRELEEESCGVFGSIDENEVSEHLVIYNKDTVIMLIHIDFDPVGVIKEFNKRITFIEKPEVSGLLILSINDLKNLIKGNLFGNRIMYSKIKDMLDVALNKNFIAML